MKEYVLNYYKEFKCVAGECKHTCCAGWEIDIDERSLDSYKCEKSSFSQSLKDGVNFKKSKFKVDKNLRCAFLNKQGLCDIIINLGEKGLCQVCRDHPRFRSFFNDRTETGLGFCCEQATKIILSFKDKIYPILISDDNAKEQLDFNQNNVMQFRQKALSIVQDRNEDIDKRITNLLSLCNACVKSEDLKKVVKLFLSLERLEKNWTKRIKGVKGDLVIETKDLKLANYAEQFLVNSLYRHLSDAEDTMWVRARTIACVFGWWLINSVYKKERSLDCDEFNLIIDVVRAYSAEVEYSQKNIDKLIAFAYKFIKI